MLRDFNVLFMIFCSTVMSDYYPIKVFVMLLNFGTKIAGSGPVPKINRRCPNINSDTRYVHVGPFIPNVFPRIIATLLKCYYDQVINIHFFYIFVYNMTFLHILPNFIPRTPASHASHASHVCLACLAGSLARILVTLPRITFRKTA